MQFILLLVVLLAGFSSSASAQFSPGWSPVNIGVASPVSSLDVATATFRGVQYSGAAIGTYAGSVAAPTNGLIVSGVVGIMTSSPAAGAALDLGSATGTAFSSLILPTGTTGTRPTSPVAGMIRYNSTTPGIEAYYSSTWNSLGGGGGGGTITLGTSTATTNPQRSGDATTGLFSAAATTVSIAVGGTEAVRVSATGSVGIGTTTPAYALQVAGTIQSNVFRGNNAFSGANSPVFMGPSGGGSPGIFFPVANSIGFSTGATETMRIDANGNLGIGAATPTNRLDVAGGIGLTATTATVPTNGIFMPAANDIRISQNLNQNFRMAGNRIYFGNTWNTFIGSDGSTAIMSGSGTITAGAALDLSGATGTAYSSMILPTGTTGTRPTTGVDGMIRYNSTTPGIEAYYSSTWNSLGGGGAGGTITLGTSTATTNPQRSGDATTGLFSAAASSVSVAVGGTEAVRVTATGSVGIGNTAPATALDVSGAIVSRAVNDGSSTSIDFSTGNSHYTSASCGAFTLSNMQDGGTYSLAINGTSAGTCSFTHTGLTFRYPPWHGSTIAGQRTVYNFARFGTDVVVAWITGY